MQPAISVIIPLYNKEKYIRRAIDSVLRQTFQNFELIVVDSSTDTGSAIVDQYVDSRIIHVQQKKETAALARNTGVSLARSDLIAFLDADDEWRVDHLESLSRIRTRYPDAGLYSTPYVKIRPDGSPSVMLFVGIPKPPWEGYLPGYLRICSRGDEPVHSSSCAVPRIVFYEEGGFPEGLVYGEDQFLWGKISLKYPIAFCWDGLAIYHTEAEGRICDEWHNIHEHPFSEYLRSELDKGNIPKEKLAECHAYIRRKRYAENFSRFVNGEKPARCEDASDLDIDRSRRSEKVRNSSDNIFVRFLTRFYHSTVHDAFRLFLCKIFGCNNPGQILKKS